MARALTAQETEVLAQPAFRVVTRVQVKDASGAFVDYSTLESYNWISSVEYGEDIDQPVADATVKLFARVHELSLAPLLQASKINNPSGSFAARIDVGRAIKIETATLPADPTIAVTESDYRLVFEGEIDEVEWGSDGGTAVLELICRDKGARLQDTFTEKEGRLSDGYAYGTNASGEPGTGTDCETIAQQILNDWMGTGVVTIYTPAGTAITPIGSDKANWLVTQYKPGKQPVIDSLRILAEQIGFTVRYRWSNVTSEMRLEFFQPDRAKMTPDLTLEPHQFFTAKTMRLTRNMVRNFVKVWYQTNPNDPETRTSITRDDPASISKYGRRYMEISEAADSAINTSTEAAKLAEACRDDLKDPKATHEVECPYYFHVQLGDLIRFKANGILFDVDQDLAVTTVRHRLADGQARTTVFCRGKPAGGYITWMKKGQVPGGASQTVDMPPLTPTGSTATASIAGMILRVPDAISSLVDHFEYHVSTTSGFTPDATTLKAKTRATRAEIAGLTAGTTYYAKILAVRKNGVKSAVSSQLSAMAGYVGDSHITTTRSLVAIGAVDVSKNIDLAASSGWANKNLEQLTTGDKSTVAGVDYALLSDVASTNLILNPSFENGVSHWTAVGSGTTRTLDTNAAKIGANGLRVVVPLFSSGAYGVKHDNITMGAGVTLTLSAYFKVTASSKDIRMKIDCFNSSDVQLTSKAVEFGVNTTMTRYAITHTTPTNTAYVVVQFDQGAKDQGSFTFHLDGVQLEQASQASSYLDGSLGTGYSWSGTAHDSTSSRTTGVKYLRGPTKSLGIRTDGIVEASSVENLSAVKIGRHGSPLSIAGSGTAFPEQPTTGDFFWRSDRGVLYERHSNGNWNPVAATRRLYTQVRKSGSGENQSISGTVVAVHFDTTDTNVGPGTWSRANTGTTPVGRIDRFTPNIAGIFLITASSTFTSVDSGQRPYWSVRIDGSEAVHQQGGYSNVASGVINLNLAWIAHVGGTGYIELWAGFNSGTGTYEYAGGGNYNKLQIHILHPENDN